MQRLLSVVFGCCLLLLLIVEGRRPCLPWCCSAPHCSCCRLARPALGSSVLYSSVACWARCIIGQHVRFVHGQRCAPHRIKSRHGLVAVVEEQYAQEVHILCRTWSRYAVVLRT